MYLQAEGQADQTNLVNQIQPTENLTNILQYDRLNQAIFLYIFVSNFKTLKDPKDKFLWWWRAFHINYKWITDQFKPVFFFFFFASKSANRHHKSAASAQIQSANFAREHIGLVWQLGKWLKFLTKSVSQRF